MPKTKPKPKRNVPALKSGRNRHVLATRRDEIPSLPEKVEQALIGGNLVNLTPEERVKLYMATCKSLRLNPLTNPFCYILVQDWENDSEKLILYAAKNCTDQLRARYGVTVVPGTLKQWREDGCLKASVAVEARNGRCDSDLGVIPLKRYSRKKQSWYELSGAQLANAEMHVVTKAKRRATLSLCGLGGIVDETELDTMKVVGGVTREGRIYRYPQLEEQTEERSEGIESLKSRGLWCEEHNCAKNEKHMREAHKEPEQAATSKPKENPPEKKQEAAAPVQAKKIVFIKTMPDHDLAVSGYLADEKMQQFLTDVSAVRFKSGKDGGTYWRFSPQYLDGFKNLCGQLGIEVA